MTLMKIGKIDFEGLQPYQKRQFMSEDFDFSDISQIKVIYQKLLDLSMSSPEDLEKWVLDRSEWEAALDQYGSILYIKMTCHTENIEYADAYKNFIENVVPVIQPLEDKLNKKYLECVDNFSFDAQRYAIHDRAIKTDVELFREENISLGTKVSLLSQEYQAVCGAMMVEFEGKARTMPEMGKYLLEQNRNLRERAWRATSQVRMQNKNKLESFFGDMLVLRDQIAKNAGFENFRDYKFVSLHRFDYTSEDCKNYHQTIEELVVPLWKEILEKRKKEMNVESLRPWDLSVDVKGRAPLKPFEKVNELIDGCYKIFNQVDNQLGGQFLKMVESGVLDLDSRKGKAPGGYQSTLNESRMPFIFMNAVGVDSDVRTLLHEGGHAFHALACAHDPLLDYRHGPMEFNEVASMGMELLGGEYLDAFYSDEDKKRSIKSHFEDIIFTLVWVATVDAFQHWMYENPKHTSDERKNAWLKIWARFGGNIVDWNDLEEEQAYHWHRQLHIFEVPFYYIEYGIAQLGALQLWLNAKKDAKQAVAKYREALRLGGSKPLPDIFKTAGLKFDFSKETVKPLVEAVKKEL